MVMRFLGIPRIQRRRRTVVRCDDNLASKSDNGCGGLLDRHTQHGTGEAVSVADAEQNRTRVLRIERVAETSGGRIRRLRPPSAEPEPGVPATA